ncbi:MAG: PDGLE domain-containing protein [Anaerolineae bacterium]
MNRIPRAFWIGALLLALAVTFLSPLASPHPDGLERVAEDQGFIESARSAPFEVIPDYTFPGIANGDVATVAAGIAGTLLVAGLTFGLAWLAHRRAAHQGGQ